MYLERPIFADTPFFAFKRNFVMPRRERNAKPSPSVSRKFGCNSVRLGLHNKRRVGERFRGRLVRSNRPRVPRADSNHAFDAGLRFRWHLHR